MAELLTAKEVQNKLHIDRSTVYRMAEDGRLPAIRIGRQWRFQPAEIDRLLQQQAPIDLPQPSEVTPHTATAELLDQLPLDCVQMIQDSFATALGLMIIITDMDGQPLTQPSNECGLFTALHEYPQVWQSCVDHWRLMAAQPVLAPAFTNSSLGLLCARGFVRVGRELKGMVFMGGVAPPSWPPTGRELDALATALRLSPKQLKPHLHKVHTLNQGEQEKALTLVQQIADIVSHMISEHRRLTAAQEQ